MFPTTDLHPMLVHFPIALVLAGFLFEAMSLFIKKDNSFGIISFYLLIFGTVSALFAWLAGLIFTSDMEGTSGKIRDIHELFAWITLGLLLVNTAIRILLRSGKTQSITIRQFSFVLYALAAASVAVTGFFGGNLVYHYMMPL